MGSSSGDRRALPHWRYLTPHVFEATRACVHGWEFCVGRWAGFVEQGFDTPPARN